MHEHTPDAVAAKPLFRDPIYDGAADPVVIWNRQTRTWLLFYTNRRANQTHLPGVSWVHGTAIGIAESFDNGAHWHYRGTAQIAYGAGEPTYWAPDVLFHDGQYHMFLTYVPAIRADWSGARHIVHLTSQDAFTWEHHATVPLASDKVIDACVVRLPDTTWRMFYNNEVDGKSIAYANSADLWTWHDGGTIVSDRSGEGPKVFFWHGRFWMVVDQWRGLAVYWSNDALHWTAQPALLLDVPGHGQDDGVMGNHADVVVNGDQAFLFYFTHPGRRGPHAAADTYEQRRSSIQVAALHYDDGVLTVDRDQPTRIALQPLEDEQ